MQLTNGSHLTFCMNIFAGESLDECLARIEDECRQVKEKFCPDKNMALGLRLAQKAAAELIQEPQKIEQLKRTLEENGFYAVTVNAFPFGNFHKPPVKENVYFPDWNTEERLIYTINCARILSQLLPENITGSISTAPITYGKNLPQEAVQTILKCGEELCAIEKNSHRRILLAIEPEPDCYLETTKECLEFWKLLEDERKSNQSLSYIGICFDTCHLSLQFEDLTESLQKIQENNIPVAKVQVSAVPILPHGCNPTFLTEYHEGIYLHQTRILHRDGSIEQFPDLGPAIQKKPIGEWRTHFHIPLDFDGEQGGLQSSNIFLTSDFLKLASQLSPCLETETYTYQVFPEAEQKTLVQSLTDELNWVKFRIEPT